MGSCLCSSFYNDWLFIYLFFSNLKIIRRKIIKLESVRKVSFLYNIDAALGLAKEADRYIKLILALRREIVYS
jgi:hypothetical protein